MVNKERAENTRPPEIILNNQILFLTTDAEIWQKQLAAEFSSSDISTNNLLNHVSTDHIMQVSHLLTDDMNLLGSRLLCGLPEAYSVEPGTIAASGYNTLVAGEYFGEGSSREQAVWSLIMSNIRVVLAKSFGPIFEKNAAYLGLLTSTDISLTDDIRETKPIHISKFTSKKDPMTAKIIEAGGLFPYLKGIKEKKFELPMPKEERDKPMNIVEQRFAKAFGLSGISSGTSGLLPVNKAYSYVGLSGLARETLLKQYEQIRSTLPPSEIYLFEDHFAHSQREQIQTLTQNQRNFSNELQLPPENYYKGKLKEGGGEGICHRVMLEKIDPRNSQVVVATDSHTPTIGALPILPIPVGSTLFAAALSEGRIPQSVPPVMRVDFSGELPPGFSIRDVQLELAATIHPSSNTMMVEYGGLGLNSLNFEQVAALCNMVPEIFKLESAVTEAYTSGINYLKDRFGISEEEAYSLYSFPHRNASYEQVVNYDLSSVSPWIALPGNPKKALSLISFKETPNIDKAFLVSCTLGLHDLAEAAAVLKDHTISPNTQLIIIPSSKHIMEAAHSKGILEILRSAGASIVPESACGPCIGEGLGAVTDGETAISASNRNFYGRMGSKKADVYLGGAIITTLSAVYGHIPTYEEYKRKAPSIIHNLNTFL